MATQEISWETFEETYQPQNNQFDDNASMGNLMFETYGEELDFVKKVHSQEPNRIWTVIDSGDSGVDVISGYHFVNRLGYIVAKTPFKTDEIIEVLH